MILQLGSSQASQSDNPGIERARPPQIPDGRRARRRPQLSSLMKVAFRAESTGRRTNPACLTAQLASAYRLII
ncbi:MAG: hypothetical protein BJ554DRAFT_886 [Olpidium bornovanus]|uniref:Uncharacterized protein n=1 Tax=Olpidium bornovanus TaxID=278681 RepID=A0A8H7ZSZ8_9FUNG|nr:MAG: hypothetical protein BJ554DRAFT_886 [Olpidium bornovanus]